MNEQDSLNLKSISYNLKKMNDLKKLELDLKLIELVYKTNDTKRINKAYGKIISMCDSNEEWL